MSVGRGSRGIALSGWRSGRAWWTLAAAFIAITVADSLYLDLSATGAYREGTLLDALWPAALLLLAASGWQRHERAALVDLEGRFFAAVPIGCGVVALVMLVVDSRLRHLNLLAVVLALGAVLTVFLRTGLSFRENRRLLDKTREQSLTDPLTELGNRRRLMSDLARALDPAAGQSWLLVILDLNGFKAYNDTFGHPSGDKLLARLAGKLALAAGPRGDAYRLGGDEFCVLAPLSGSDSEVLIDDATAALYEEGEGFTITAAFGAAVLPEDALRLLVVAPYYVEI